MAWFKKRKDVVDLTYLAKRGIVKVPQQTEEYKDLSSSNSSSSSSDSGFGFLAGMASSAESSPSSLSSSSSSSSILASKGVSNKIEDFEYKLDAISKRVNVILDRLDLVEKKLDRDLRNGSLN